MRTELNRGRGFSLIEMVIAIVIVGILAAVAFPSYQSYIVRGNRAAAQAFMMDVAARQKQYFLDNRSYASDLATLNVTAPTDVTRHYGTIAISVSSPPPAFLITATPTSAQQSSDGELKLDSNGTKTPASKW